MSNVPFRTATDREAYGRLYAEAARRGMTLSDFAGRLLEHVAKQLPVVPTSKRHQSEVARQRAAESHGQTEAIAQVTGLTPERLRELRAPADVVHACPPAGQHLTPCCWMVPTELPRSDRITTDPALVTCTG